MTTTLTPSRLPRAAGLLLTGVLTLAPLTGAQALVSAGVGPSGPCTDPSGVTVVVDLTDLGGEVETGCATDPATGTEALQQAGFTDTRDASGLICAIESMPDPCPAEFEGVYWSYWFAEPGGQWQTYMEGPDTAAPAPGSVEGWRYSDGSAGPTVQPPVPAGAAATAEPTPTEPATDETAEPTEETDDAADDAAAQAEPRATDDPMVVPGSPREGGSGVVVGVAALIAALAAGAVLLARHRRSDRANGPAGQS